MFFALRKGIKEELPGWPEVVVVFDGEDGSAQRKAADGRYKANRRVDGEAVRPIRALAETLASFIAACPEMTALASLIASFAALLAPDPGSDGRLQEWIADARAAVLPHLQSFTRGLDLDIQAVTAALTLPHHNGRTEGAINIKMVKRQMFGRAGLPLLRKRVLLTAKREPMTSPSRN